MIAGGACCSGSGVDGGSMAAADACRDRLLGRCGAGDGKPLRCGFDAVGSFRGLDPLGDPMGRRKRFCSGLRGSAREGAPEPVA